MNVHPVEADFAHYLRLSLRLLTIRDGEVPATFADLELAFRAGYAAADRRLQGAVRVACHAPVESEAEPPSCLYLAGRALEP